MSRRLDVDVVRAVALVSMYVAHVAPSAGPANVLTLSEYLTMPLFALLIGVGWALEQAGAQVLIVLIHLGVLLVVATLMAHLPGLVVAALGVLAYVTGPQIYDHILANGYFLGTSEFALEVQGLLWTDYAYRVHTMVVYAAIGILLARRWLGRKRAPITEPLIVGGAALAAAAVLLAVDHTGRIELRPYSGTYLESFFNCLLVIGALGVGLVIGRVLPRVIAAPIAMMGAMTLTLYSLQILWLAFDVRVWHPGSSDNSWLNLVILTAGSFGFAWLWHVLVRREPWRRGPLEGPVAALTR